MNRKDLPFVGETPTPYQQENLDRIYAAVVALYPAGTIVRRCSFLHTNIAYEPVGATHIRVTAHWPSGSPVNMGELLTLDRAVAKYRGTGADAVASLVRRARVTA